MSIVHSLGKVFERLRPLLALLFSYGRQLRVESSRWITLEDGVSFYLIGVAKRMRKLLIIFSSIASILLIFGTWFLIYLGVFWVMPSNILELLHGWKFQGRGHSKGAIWKVILALLMWST